MSEINSNGININSVTNRFAGGVDGAQADLSEALTRLSESPDDPTTMFEVQKALSVYNLTITMESSIVKSLEDTMKSFTNRM